MKLSKVYEPAQYESDIYKLWEESGAFKPDNTGKGSPYCIVMPPPNANAGLHIGYALTSALEDISARFRRMQGSPTLLLPGADHAGFETQVVYEKKLAKEGKSRFDFTRDELYKQIWDFVQENKGIAEEQIRAFGASADWSKFTFTLDEKIIDTAYKTFKKMWDEELIYRGERLVNYCTYHGTGFADIEVAHQEKKGYIWTLIYPLASGRGEIKVATTRPETMLGDVAVAVNPSDKRYKPLVGQKVKLPLTDREVEIIADDFVDPDFGTGAVKITPAHDPNDYEAGERHNLPKISVIGYDGKLNGNAPEKYQKLTVLEAREAVVADLDQAGLIAEVKQHINSVGRCYKCNTVIEPLLMKQWFINMKPLAKDAISALKAGKIKFYPDSKKDQLIKYLGGLRDWNISRQIAWGIPIPAFVNTEDDQDWIYDERVDHETIEVDGKIYHRDPDVFDTWFSSSSWPYATLGGNDDKFYPNGLMETGGEILYPWVSRMIMLGLYVKNDVPFKEVYIHGYVMSEDGSKMSKSVGNVVDPLPIIKEYGSDALRMGIVSGRSPATNTGYDHRRVIDARNFCNKLWNIARYTESKISNGVETDETKAVAETPADHWILSRLDTASKRLEKLLSNYEFSEAYETVYHLIWDDIADWYIEASKNQSPQMLDYALSTSLKLVHPFAPFVSETIWQTLYPHTESLLITQKWPKIGKFDESIAADFEQIQAITTEVRHIKNILKANSGELRYIGSELIKNNSTTIKNLAGLTSVSQGDMNEGINIISSSGTAKLVIAGKGIEKLLGSIETKAVDNNKLIANIEKRLKNKNYIEKAPKYLIEESKLQLEKLKDENTLLKEQLQKYSG